MHSPHSSGKPLGGSDTVTVRNDLIPRKMAEPNVEQAIKDYATVASLAEEILADKQQVLEKHRQISFVLLIERKIRRGENWLERKI